MSDKPKKFVGYVNCRFSTIVDVEAQRIELDLRSLYGDKPINTPVAWCAGPWHPKNPNQNHTD